MEAKFQTGSHAELASSGSRTTSGARETRLSPTKVVPRVRLSFGATKTSTFPREDWPDNIELLTRVPRDGWSGDDPSDNVCAGLLPSGTA